jgi:hypothetical protein
MIHRKKVNKKKKKEGRGVLDNKFYYNQYNDIIKYGAMKTNTL